MDTAQEKLFRQEIGYFKADLYDLLGDLKPKFFLDGAEQWFLGVGQVYQTQHHSLRDMKTYSVKDHLPLVQSEADPKVPLYQIIAPFDPDEPITISVPKIAITGTANSDKVLVTANHFGSFEDFDPTLLDRILSSIYTPTKLLPVEDGLLKELEPLDFPSWERMFSYANEAIDTHELEKIVLSMASIAHKTPSFSEAECLRRLKQSIQGSHLFYAAGYLGVTPELVLRLKNGIALSTPLAGTRKTENMNELSTSIKDIHEHSVVVDAITDGLGLIAQNVKCSDPKMFPAGPITHIATEIYANDFKDEVNLLSVLANIAPTPAICGDPQESALSVIRKLERDKREFFGGLVGTMDAELDGEAYLAIRSFKDLGDKVRFQAGVGLVDGSDAIQEFAEMHQKIASVYQPLTDSKEHKII